MCDGFESFDYATSEPSSSSLTNTTEQSLSSGAEHGGMESNAEGREQEVVYLLDRLKQPQSSTLARKRMIALSPLRGMKRSKGVTVNDPKSVCASDRVRSYMIRMSR